MAKKSIWRRLGDAVRRIVGVPRPEPAPPQPPPQPPAPPPIPSNYRLDETRIEIYEDITDTRRDADEWWDLFSDTGIPGVLNYDETNNAWNDFLRAWWLNTSEAGHIPRTEFMDTWDVPDTLIDWDHWREIKKTP